MQESQPVKVLLNNIHFYKRNIDALLKMRPTFKLIFKSYATSVSYSIDKNSEQSIDNLEFTINTLPALNSALIINCFSLFEASFESHLLHKLDTVNLTGIQEQVMNKYIDDIIKLSSEERYSKEFKFITGISLQSFFSPEEYEKYKVIKEFYLIRNLLVHGSAAKKIFVPMENGGKIQMDLDDKEFQGLVVFVKSKIDVDIADSLFTLDLLLINNDVTDLLIDAVVVVSAKLFDNTKYKIKFLKDDIFKTK